MYLVADSAEVGKITFASLGGVDLVHYWITDSGISTVDRYVYEQRVIQVIVAE